MSVESEPAMSREEFDRLFLELLSSIEPWKLNSVADHVHEFARNWRSNGRKPRKRKERKARKQRGNRREAYFTYMRSELWKEIRSVVLERDRHECLCCGEPATEVHHRSYSAKVMAGNDNSKLASICGRCHNRLHYTDDNKKRSKKETEQEYLRAIEARIRRRRVSSRCEPKTEI